MNPAAIIFVFATIFTLRFPIHISSEIVWAFVLFSPIAAKAMFKPATRTFGAFYLGVLYVIISAHLLLAQSLPSRLEQKDITVEGYVSSLPVHSQADREGLKDTSTRSALDHAKFQFQVEKSNEDWAGGLIQLSWYGERRVSAGQNLRLKVRLNKPRGLVNDGLFDYEAWLFSRGVVATGYVRSAETSLDPKPYNFSTFHHQVRQFLSQRIEQLAGDHPHTSLLLALSVGESQKIPPAMWDVLSGTGTNHLLIISGLHVGLVAALSLSVLTFTLKALPNYRLVAGMLSGLTTLAYGALAGFGLPVQRALMMVAIVYLALLLKRSSSVLTLCCSALLGVVLLDPFASLSIGFWLSFGAVFLLLFVFSISRGGLSWQVGEGHGEDVKRLSRNSMSLGSAMEYRAKFIHWCRQMLYSQWVVYAGMCPLMLVLVAQFAPVGFLANLIAIPFVSVLIVPLILLSLPAVLLSDGLGGWMIALLLVLLSWLWNFLEHLDGWKLSFFSTMIPLAVGLLAIAGMVLVFSPRGLIPKWLSVFFLLPMLKVQFPERIEQGEIRMTLLDVGQGLSVIVEGTNHTIVYDAGPRYGDRFDTGQQIVTAFLRGRGVSRIDKLIVSHNDNDHAGGAEAVKRNFPVDVTLRGKPLAPADVSCHEAPNWRLDGVNYSFVKRIPGSVAKNQNDSSCVVIIETNYYSILLPGDIGLEAEENLVFDVNKRIDLLVSPHHGSITSSGPGFLNRIDPDVILISSGYRNKFGHPHVDVMKRYRARSIAAFNTAETGAITVSTGSGSGLSFARERPAGLWRPDSYVLRGLKPDEARFSQRIHTATSHWTLPAESSKLPP